MKQKEFIQHLSLYIDGEMSADDTKDFEHYLTHHPEADASRIAWTKQRKLLAERKALESNPFFWEQLNATLVEKQEQNKRIIPVPRRFVPASLALGSLIIIALLFIVYSQRDHVFSYFFQRTHDVRVAYDEGIKGWFLPLFKKTSKDQVLAFAMFGTLPLDETLESVLRIDNTGTQGYRVELGKTPIKRQTPVSVEELYREIRPTKHQQQSIDSLLSMAQHQIESAVLLSTKEKIAIDPRLIGLNKAILNSVASQLEPGQRIRFDDFLSRRNTAYTVAVHVASSPSPPAALRASMTDPNSSEVFFVLGEETAILKTIHVNLDSMREVMRSVVGKGPEISVCMEAIARKLTESAQTRKHYSDRARTYRIQADQQLIAIQEFESRVNQPENIFIRVRDRDRKVPAGNGFLPTFRFTFSNASEDKINIHTDDVLNRVIENIPEINVCMEMPLQPGLLPMHSRSEVRTKFMWKDSMHTFERRLNSGLRNKEAGTIRIQRQLNRPFQLPGADTVTAGEGDPNGIESSSDQVPRAWIWKEHMKIDSLTVLPNVYGERMLPDSSRPVRKKRVPPSKPIEI